MRWIRRAFERLGIVKQKPKEEDVIDLLKFTNDWCSKKCAEEIVDLDGIRVKNTLFR